MKEIKEKIEEILENNYIEDSPDLILELLDQKKQKWVEEILPKKDNFNNKLEESKAYSPAELGTIIGRVGYKEGWNACLEQIIKNA